MNKAVLIIFLLVIPQTAWAADNAGNNNPVDERSLLLDLHVRPPVNPIPKQERNRDLEEVAQGANRNSADLAELSQRIAATQRAMDAGAENRRAREDQFNDELEEVKRKARRLEKSTRATQWWFFGALIMTGILVLKKLLSQER